MRRGKPSPARPLGTRPDKPLAGRVIIVTGASRGIGRAIALRLARDGAKIVLTARDAAKLAEVVKQIELEGGAGVSIPIDLRSPEAASAVVDTGDPHLWRDQSMS